MKLTANISFGKETLDSRQVICECRSDDGREEQIINLYPDVIDQQLEGFGGAITDAAGYVYHQMNNNQKEEVLNTYFKTEEMNYQLVRIHMDSCDFSTHMYAAQSDEAKAEFSFADTEKYIIPMLDAAQQKARKKLKLMLSPWSPPAFMKTNGKRTYGGSLKPEYRKPWAEYICRYIREFRDRGYQVQRISLQNEPKAVQTWDSCVYTGQQEKEFLKDYLYPALKREHLDEVEVFVWDHNKERLFDRAKEVIDDTTDPMITGLAFHWYSGDHFEAIDLVRRKFPDKKLILSESCLELCKYDSTQEGENAGRLAHDMIGNLNSGMQAFYDWNMLLDQDGGPNHVSNYCDAPFLYHNAKQSLEKRRILRYYWHFAHFIKPGAVRIAHTRYTDALDVTAWKNPDGKIIMIVLNRTGVEIPYYVRVDGEIAAMTAPSDSVTSSILT
ncbi:MAG: glycoside hydrolase family 30 protein [Lachnospiraceae bacterium]